MPFDHKQLCVDANGKFVGSCAAVTAVEVVPSPPPDPDPRHHKWYTWNSDSQEWIEDVETAKAELIERLKRAYSASVAETDARLMQYQKRQALGVADASDEADYQAALKKYNTLTAAYRSHKNKINAATTLADVIQAEREMSDPNFPIKEMM